MKKRTTGIPPVALVFGAALLYLCATVAYGENYLNVHGAALDPDILLFGSPDVPHPGFHSIKYQEPDAELVKLKDVLEDFIRASPEDFQKYRAGLGIRANNSLIYPSSLSVPGASKTFIRVDPDEGQAFVSATVFVSSDKNDKQKAAELYGNYVSKLKAMFPDKEGQERKQVEPSEELSYSVGVSVDNIKATVAIIFISRTNGDSRVILKILTSETPGTDSTTSTTTTTKPDTKPVTDAIDVDLKTTTQEIVRKFVATEYESIRETFNKQTQLSLTAERMAQVWSSIVQQLGSFKSQEAPQVSRSMGYDVVTIRCQMERGEVDVEVTYDREGKVGGLWMRPINRVDPEVVERLKKSGVEVANKIVAADFEGAREQFNGIMKAGLSAQTLAEIWSSVLQQFGSFKSLGAPQIGKIQNFDVVYVRCEMERGSVVIEISYDQDRKIAGLYVRPNM